MEIVKVITIEYTLSCTYLKYFEVTMLFCIFFSSSTLVAAATTRLLDIFLDTCHPYMRITYTSFVPGSLYAALYELILLR